MNRRDLLKASLLTAGAVTAQGAVLSENMFAAAAGEKKPASTPMRKGNERMPNVLWVCPDSQRADTIQALNNPHIHTPVLNKFMQESVTFTNAFVQTPICGPSRGSFLTGRYPRETGLRANAEKINPTERIVPRILADHGYDCGLVGKLHLSPCDHHYVESRIDDGYRVFEWSHDISNNWPGKNQWRNWLDAQGVKWPVPPPQNRRTSTWGVPIDPRYTQTAWCADRAIHFIQQHPADKPWMLSVNMYQPHHPFFPAEDYLKRYDPAKMPEPAYKEGELDNKPVYQQMDHRGAYGGHGLSFAKEDDKQHRKTTAAYYAMIEQVDAEFGRILDAVEKSGMADNTVVIFMSDHGEMLGDHGIYCKGPYFYDCLNRVPLMIRWPNKYKAGLKVDALVELVDIAPTVMDAAGIEIPVGMQGKSLTPLLTGAAKDHRDSVYIEFYNAVGKYDPTPMATCVRTATHKLAYYQSLGTGELYDLAKDPGEFNNLWNHPDSKDVQNKMTQLLLARMIGSLDPLPVHAW